MPDPSGFRRQRIEKLLKELRYEVERGMMEREIEETLGFLFYVTISASIPDGVVVCEFKTRPVRRDAMNGEDLLPRSALIP